MTDVLFFVLSTFNLCYLIINFSTQQAAVSISQGVAKHRLEFLIGSHVLPYTMTVYQAMKQFSQGMDRESETDTDSEHPFGNATIWVQTHTIW